MGNTSSRLEKALAELPDGERFFGLENFGNTCYCNSVLQALYFCIPFREKVIAYIRNKQPDDTDNDNLLANLGELFQQISTQPRKTGCIPPRKFVISVKRENEMFRSYMHQDAHEFFIILLSSIAEVLEKEKKKEQQQEQRGTQQPQPQPPPGGEEPLVGVPEALFKRSPSAAPASAPRPLAQEEEPSTWLHSIFGGKSVTYTRCLQCETANSRQEDFLDLSIEIDGSSSLGACLSAFSGKEILDKQDKYFCDRCGCEQEGQKWTLIQSAPEVLVFHLKRFKFSPQINRMRKLMHRVSFPLKMQLPNTAAATLDPDADYDLFAVVVHIGSGPHHGHYVCLVKSHDRWWFFDDDLVVSVDESAVQETFGMGGQGGSRGDQHGYLLFYQKVRTPVAGSAGGSSSGSCPSGSSRGLM